MTGPETPLSPDTLDELLSADIDGELARAAADLGFTVEEAIAAIAATPDASRRRLALTRARDLLAVPVPLPESTELRLVATAIDRAHDEVRAAREHPRRAWRVLVAAGSAAAVIAGVVALAHTNPGESSKASSSAGAKPATAPGRVPARSRDSVAFGDVSNPLTLRAVVEVRLNMPAASATKSVATGGAGTTGAQGLVGHDGGVVLQTPQGGTGGIGVQGPSGAFDRLSALPAPQGPQGVQGDEGIQGVAGPTGPTGATATHRIAGGVGPIGPTAPLPTFAADAQNKGPTPAARAGSGQRCIAAVEQQARLGSAPVLSGTGTDAGFPVYVAVFPRGQSFVVYVLAASDCAVVSRQTIP